ncbi:EAL domain-containing protein [Nitrogeniibacter mangrovi]|uniref:EAL domain-containing protein n=1 Tax=Nitrogeniibacter mangrovi TaxID=2016596 RepID=A0A6C1B2E5_9RHOO|nr:EAL domain-containing protein [Nitrogeniibacter mangrovi]QID17159.1 EAL domain-containing protein [Nitrogeniibacter mangrovi]
MARAKTLASVTRIEQIISTRALGFEFQPIAHLSQRTLHGFEALMRGPAGSELASPERMLEVARYAGLSLELERLSCLEAIKAFARLQLPGLLFLNASAGTIASFAEPGGGGLIATAREHGISEARLVLELTEHERVTDIDRFAGTVAVLRDAGIKLALDDFGDGRSSVRLWTQLKPELVKFDRFFVRDAHVDARKHAVLKSLFQLAEALDTPVVIEGIETREDLMVARDLGCQFAQGYLLGRPHPAPARELRTEVCAWLAQAGLASAPMPAQRRNVLETVESLLVHAPTVRPGDSCEAVLRTFGRHEDVHALAVVQDDRPIGLINRQKFTDKMSQPFHIDLFGRRPCAIFMDPNPLRVDRYSGIESLATVMLGEDQRYLTDGFIVTDGGAYAGLGTGERLVRAVTERRIEAARLANPLTCLPGNIPITDHIRRLLGAEAPFSAAYFDLNHFKPYNDLYGYWRGDEMIKLAAAVMVRHCDSRCDFLGHVGGDDFVVLFQSPDWVERCEAIIEEFNRRARCLFDDAELARGGFVSEDRRGHETFFPLTSISVGVVTVPPGCAIDPEGVASSAAAAKKAAKRAKDHFFAAGDIRRDSGRFEHAAVA